MQAEANYVLKTFSDHTQATGRCYMNGSDVVRARSFILSVQRRIGLQSCFIRQSKS